HRPDLLKYATTNNKGTTGDGHKLALAVGAKAVDLDDVQVHLVGLHHWLPPSMTAMHTHTHHHAHVQMHEGVMTSRCIQLAFTTRRTRRTR
ncbi:MAG: FAD-binding protein, partial [Promethearchaeia archaeon]